MNDTNRVAIERNIAQCRILLSIAAPLAVYVDPTEPILMRFAELSGAPFFIDARALTILLAHLAYSVAIYLALQRRRLSLDRIVSVSTWGDVFFAATVASVTEGTNSPFYVYFLFAALTVGLRGSARKAIQVTVTSVALYVGLILAARPDGLGFYLTRAVYLAITGYLAGFLGRQRRILESNVEGLTRSLHDGYAQTLAGVNLRLQTSRELIRRDRSEEALDELTELQTSVTREYDELRAYVRSLQGLAATRVPLGVGEQTRFLVRAQFDAPFPIVEHALQIMLEGARNVCRHAQARSAVISANANSDSERVIIRIDDDGIGFPPDARPPWSIASRAAEVGGKVRVGGNLPSGGQVVVDLPKA